MFKPHADIKHNLKIQKLAKNCIYIFQEQNFKGKYEYITKLFMDFFIKF